LWSELYEALSNYDKGEFRRLCNYLLSRTYLVRDVYRPEKKWIEPNNDYRTVGRLFDCMREYFIVSGWRLERDEQYGVISLINEFDHNRTRFDRFTTLFLYTCRLIYEEGREHGDSQRIVRTDTGAIVEKMRFFGLLERGRTTQKERLEAQRTLAHYNIIQKMESSAWSPEGNSILILPSILSIITNQGINDMIQELEELKTDDADAGEYGAADTDAAASEAADAADDNADDSSADSDDDTDAYDEAVDFLENFTEESGAS